MKQVKETTECSFMQINILGDSTGKLCMIFFHAKFQFLFVSFNFFLLGIIVALAILIHLIERVI